MSPAIIRAVRERALGTMDVSLIRVCGEALNGDPNALATIEATLREDPLPVAQRGRPPLPDGTAADVRVRVYLTPAQLAQLDRDRGAESRSAYLARRAGL